MFLRYGGVLILGISQLISYDKDTSRIILKISLKKVKNNSKTRPGKCRKSM